MMPRTTNTKNNQGLFRGRGGGGGGDRLLLSVGNMAFPDETTITRNGNSNNNNKRIRRDDNDEDDDDANNERNIEVEEPHPSAIVPSAIVPSAVESSRLLVPSSDASNNENIDTIKKIVTKDLSSVDWTVVTTGLDVLGKLCDSRIHGMVKATSSARLFHELGGQGILLHFITKYHQQRQALMEWTLYVLHHSVKLHFGLLMSSCLIDAVLQTMERHANNQLIQLYGILFLNTLLDYAPDSEQQKSEMAYMILVKYRGLPVVEEATRRFPTWKNVQTAAVQLVWDLINILPGESRDTIEDAGGLVILASGITCLKGGVDELWCNRAKEMMNYFTNTTS